jgi:UDPglucose 6-dehydrogenase
VTPINRQSDGPIAVIGLWHLGAVTAACLAEAGYEVIGFDPEGAVVDDLNRGLPPISEPGLSELVGAGLEQGRLSFSSDAAALGSARLAWVTFDTPVDEQDRADVEWVLSRCEEILSGLAEDTLVLISSQLPVGSAEILRARVADRRGDLGVRVACVPENLRLGQALDSFRRPERFVVGVREERDRREIAELLERFGGKIEWMGVESAEMTKHALNSFLATSVAFINEVASICERVGADAAEVSRGLKSEPRIGPRAYLGPGEAFAGGTLARDIHFLGALAEKHGLPDDVLAGVARGNVAHKGWTERKLLELLAEGPGGEGHLAGRRIGLWGLTYKPGTDTLRRSSAVELCRSLHTRGALVRAHDPAIDALPAELAEVLELCPTPIAAAEQADVLVLCTAWPEYRDVRVEELRDALKGSIVIDPTGFLADAFPAGSGFRYARVGSSPGATELDMAGRR